MNEKSKMLEFVDYSIAMLQGPTMPRTLTHHFVIGWMSSAVRRIGTDVSAWEGITPNDAIAAVGKVLIKLDL